MKKLIFLSLLLSSVVVFSQAEGPDLLKKVEGFSHPESVVYDEDRGHVYISNIGKKEPGDGFISKTNLQGEVLELQWITDLNDPIGLLIHEDILYVTDNTELIEMDIKSGTIINKTKVEGAQFLNDIAADAEANIYISDTGNSSIYFMKNGSIKIDQWLSSEELEFPNGLLVADDHIYVAAWGGENGGNLLKVSLNNKEVTKVSQEPIGNLDGIQLNNNNNFYISDWATGDIHEIDRKGKISKILTSEKSAGDILFHSGSGKLVLPMNHQNAVWWYQINE